MQNIFSFKNPEQRGNFLAMFIIAFFVVLSLIRLYPFHNDLSVIITSIDDWGRYARYALEIKNESLFIVSVNECYAVPAGFLYNYFVALCFYLFGENTIPVYFIQSLLLAFSIVFVYLAFRDKMQNTTSILMLLTLFMFALVDTYKYYSFQLLSENLAIFTISAFFLFFNKGIENNKLILQLAAAFLMGLTILIRPNILPFEIMLVILFIGYFLKHNLKKSRLIIFLTVLILSSSLLLIRNYLVCKQLLFFPAITFSIFHDIFHQVDFSWMIYIKKALFIFGMLSPLEPEYHWRPHWTLMWIGYFIYLLYNVKNVAIMKLWEVTSHLFIFSYLLMLLFIVPDLGSYGFRFMIPVILIVLPFSFMGLDRLRAKFNW